MKNYNIGDKVWLASCGSREKYNPCPICAGKKKVTLILGSGEECLLDCDYCARGYDSPSGTELEFESFVEPREVIVSKFETDGKTFNYHFEGNYYGEQDLVFDTKAAAEVKCREIVAQRHAEEQKRLEWGKEKSKKSYAWHAGYHKREAKSCEERMNYHKTKAQFMAAKGKIDSD